MPKFGLTMHEGTVQRYFKAVGESVAAGEPLYEVETEKVLYEVEAPSSGVVAALLVEEGATVECGVAVAILAEDGEDPSTISERYQSRAPSNGSIAPPRPAENVVAAASASRAGSGRRPVSPVAKKLAAELGVNLDSVDGTGP